MSTPYRDLFPELSEEEKDEIERQLAKSNKKNHELANEARQRRIDAVYEASFTYEYELGYKAGLLDALPKVVRVK